MNFLYTIQPFHAPNFICRMSPVEKEIPRWIAFETIEKNPLLPILWEINTP